MGNQFVSQSVSQSAGQNDESQEPRVHGLLWKQMSADESAYYWKQTQ